jgi:hypothetical protein
VSTAIAFSAYGEPEVLEANDVEKFRPGEGQYWVRTLGGVRAAGRLSELVGLYEQGRLRVHIQNAHPLRDASRAHLEIETGHVRGKIVLTVG